jgi:aspartyl-tRNA synthetase
MLEYGSDKPDLRNPIKITDVSAHFAGGGFRLFANIIASGGVVRAIPAPGANKKGRAFFDRMDAWAKEQGHPGLGYIYFENLGRGSGTFDRPNFQPRDNDSHDFSASDSGDDLILGKGPIANNVGEATVRAICLACNLGPDDGVLFAAGKPDDAAKLAGKTRNQLGEQLGLIEENAFRFCWVTDFPMYERNEDTGQIEFSHNPFSMPQGGLEALNSMDPLDIKAFQYDIVCNGIELSSGAIRNHRPDIMIRAFEIAGYPAEEVEHRFGGMLNAFRYGAPPHGGSAPGIDRIVMLIADEPAIREVILFPMNQQAEDLMMGAPARVPPERLKELHIKLDLPPVKGSKPG